MSDLIERMRSLEQDHEPDEDCEVCQGGIEYEQKVTVPWTTCKQIYKRMAESAIKSGGL